MASFLLLILSLAAGVILRRAGKMPENAASTFTTFVIWVSLPAMTLLRVHDMHFTLQWKWLAPAAMPWLVFVCAALMLPPLARRRAWAKPTVGALVLTAGLGNTSFVGFPLLEALYGERALATGVLIDQLGSFFVLSTLAVVAVAWFGAKASTPKGMGRMLSFPPFIAFVFAIVTHAVAYPAAINGVLERLSALLAPLALFAVGLRLRISRDTVRRHRAALAIGLSFKLVVAPALTILLFVVALGMRGEAIRITIVEAAMAPMIMAGVVAAEANLAPELADTMVAFGVPLSLLTAPLWAYVAGIIA